jgi:hypothetical protein
MTYVEALYSESSPARYFISRFEKSRRRLRATQTDPFVLKFFVCGVRLELSTQCVSNEGK